MNFKRIVWTTASTVVAVATLTGLNAFAFGWPAFNRESICGVGTHVIQYEAWDRCNNNVEVLTGVLSIVTLTIDFMLIFIVIATTVLFSAVQFKNFIGDHKITRQKRRR